ncbi:hypothetical protein EON77_10615, partial [bacterium]
MNLNDPGTLSSLAELQAPLWNSVATIVGASVGADLKLTNPLTTTARPADLQADGGANLIVSFALANAPESIQSVLLRQETLLDFAKIVTGLEPTDVDENVVADVRHIAEAFVQGLCLAIGQTIGETVVATGLSIRYQNFTPTPNFQRVAEIVRVNVAIESDDVRGVVVWAFDRETAAILLKQTGEDEEIEANPFQQAPRAGGTANLPQSDPGRLDILLDVPLEISVELGRVRMTVREVVDLGTGSIVEVDKAAGE